MEKCLQLEITQSIAWITINRPKLKNALSFDMTKDFIKFLSIAANDATVRVIVLRGRGSDFSSGGDIGDIAGALSDNPASRAAEFRRNVQEMSVPLAEAFQRIRQPVIASVRGHVIGVAAQMMLMSDLVVASETTRILVPQLRLAHVPDHGESYSLPRRVGLARAMQMLLLTEPCTGVEAERYGIANWVVADTELENKTEEVANRLVASPINSVVGIKALLRASPANSLDQQLKLEIDVVGGCAASDDFVEAISAFLEKRTPKFGQSAGHTTSPT